MWFFLSDEPSSVCVKGEIFPTHSTLYFTSIRDKLMENFSISKNIHVKFAFLGRKYYDRITWKLSAQSSKVERKIYFHFFVTMFPFNWIGAICDVVSVVSQIYTPTFVDGRREHNVLSVERRHERFIGVAGRLSTSQHIRERDIDTNSRQHCRANEAAESESVRSEKSFEKCQL